eukprot:979390-Pelagomonas_calceolata.AAC.2
MAWGRSCNQWRRYAASNVLATMPIRLWPVAHHSASYQSLSLFLLPTLCVCSSYMALATDAVPASFYCVQAETNTKIAIRGRGSVKEGIHKDGKYDYGEDEELHVLITGNTQQDVSSPMDNKCVRVCMCV